MAIPELLTIANSGPTPDPAMNISWQTIRATPILDSIPALIFALFAALAIRDATVWWQSTRQARTWEKWHGYHKDKATKVKKAEMPPQPKHQQ